MPLLDTIHVPPSWRCGAYAASGWRRSAAKSAAKLKWQAERHDKTTRRNALDSVDFDALEHEAHAKMPPASFAFCAAGADDEISVAENISDWRRLRLRPRVLRSVENVDTSVTLLGETLATPIMVAPTGRHKLFHPEGERATARGATMAGMPYCMASNSNILIEDVAAERKAAPQWFSFTIGPTAPRSKL